MWLFAVLASLTTISFSQNTNVPQLPLCAQGCLVNATSQQGSCSNADIKCLCSDKTYGNSLSCCIIANCSVDDQNKAAAYTFKLCTTVNIVIATTLSSCSSIMSRSSSSRITSSSSSRLSSGMTSHPTQITTTSVSRSATSIPTLESAITIPSNAPVAQFTGGALLNGSCAAPQFASVTASGGVTLEYPWIGCSYDRPNCCPFDIKVGGSLSICPRDYTTTNSACCPSGWSIYTTAFAGQTPCYSTPPLPLIPPTTSSTPASATRTANASISIISTQIFTLQYPLRTSTSRSSLSGGAKAGIAIGVLLGVFLAAALGFLLLRRRRRHRISAEQSPSSPTAAFEHPTPLPPEHISELPSPGPTEQRSSWLPAAQRSPISPFPEQPPVELSGTPIPSSTPPGPPEMLPARAWSGFPSQSPAPRSHPPASLPRLSVSTPQAPVELPTPWMPPHPAYRLGGADEVAVSPIEDTPRRR